MSTIEVETPADLLSLVGSTAGPTPWLKIEQPRIDQFAEATEDRQWIHVDVDRAKDGPFGATIAHGYLTLSLVSAFLPDLLRVRSMSMGVNYGCEKVRFPNAVKSGARIRGRGEVIKVEEVKGGVQIVVRVTIDIEDEERPACVVDTVSRFYP
ncbi:MAG: MaoC family dehydratase [Pseudomonadota bacterium]